MITGNVWMKKKYKTIDLFYESFIRRLGGWQCSQLICRWNKFQHLSLNGKTFAFWIIFGLGKIMTCWCVHSWWMGRHSREPPFCMEAIKKTLLPPWSMCAIFDRLLDNLTWSILGALLCIHREGLHLSAWYKVVGTKAQMTRGNRDEFPVVPWVTIYILLFAHKQAARNTARDLKPRLEVQRFIGFIRNGTNLCC